MKRIPAIVLTYDANHLYTNHMVRLYNRLWPDNPFRFLVPYQSQEARLGLMEVSPSVQVDHPLHLFAKQFCPCWKVIKMISGSIGVSMINIRSGLMFRIFVLFRHRF